MCSRINEHTPGSELTRELELAQTPPDLGIRYNIAPSSDVLALATPHQAQAFKWGLVPWWAKDPAIASHCINARSETAAEKPAFREALKRRRCLVIVDGFYEWQTVGKQKLPFHFAMPDERPYCLAGVWETWRPPDAPPETEALHSLCILTTTANDLVAPLHDRMPVIIDRANWNDWLDPHLPADAVQRLLVPWPAERLTARPVSTYVNDPRHEGPECLAPRKSEQLRLF